MTVPTRAVIVRNGQERGLHDLNRGDVIAFREFDANKGYYRFYVLSETPASDEVKAAGWDCEARGHKYWHPNGAPSKSCTECGA